MSETISVALITFASGLFGTLVGAISAYLTARNTAKSEQAILLHTEKRECYSAFLASYHTFAARITASDSGLAHLPGGVEQELFANFQIAYSKALLLASKDTEKALTALYTCVIELGETRTVPKHTSDAFTKAVEAMRSEVKDFKRW